MSTQQPEDIDEILRMTQVLAEVHYRDLSSTCNQQRIAVCRRLWHLGFNEQLLRMLWAYAQSFAQSPANLFCWWMDRPSRTTEKLDEMRANSEWTRRTLAHMEHEKKAAAKPAPIFDMKQRRAGGS